MTLFELSSLLLTLAAVFSYINYRFIKLPTTIGVMLIAMVVSLVIVVLNPLGLESVHELARSVMDRVDFNETLMQGMLSFLLFAGALHVDLGQLARHKWIIGILATIGVVSTTFMVGYVSSWVFAALGFDLPFIYCLLFGALIAPTDPVAVLAILKTAGVPKSLETKVAGESLFNDGVAVVVFLVISGIAISGEPASPGHVAMLFLEEAGGGIVFGLVIGYIAFWMLRGVDGYQVEALITLALVAGGYSLAQRLHVSGPIAMVVAGLLIGNQGRSLAMTDRSREHLDGFWELIDEVLNAVLFLLIGFELIAITIGTNAILAGLVMIPLVLLARLISVGIPMTLMRRFTELSPNAIKILTWGGLRGGISVALALSLPAGPERDLLVCASYVVVVFSILVQGTTIKRLVQRTEGRDA